MASERPYLLLVNGPNLNRLGIREPAVYGTDTLDDIVHRVVGIAAGYGVDVRAFQSNHEGGLIDFLQDAADRAVGVVLNPGAYAHYGYALRDCLADLHRPVIEVHISNVHRREPFRHELVLAPVVTGQIVGLGTAGYELAARYLLNQFMLNSGEGNE